VTPEVFMLSDWYLWIKAFHIMSVIAWMAGLFYLPRLYVYHVERNQGEEPRATLEIMETKLLRVIMNPAMIASWVFGLLLVAVPGVVDFSVPWVWLKLAGILAMSWFHMWLARQRRLLADGGPGLRGRQYRMMNEVPTVLMVLIVLSVVIKF
jgi:protoporphyrinogen IX oxidase